MINKGYSLYILEKQNNKKVGVGVKLFPIAKYAHIGDNLCTKKTL
jgi:hypothetical protein